MAPAPSTHAGRSTKESFNGNTAILRLRTSRRSVLIALVAILTLSLLTLNSTAEAVTASGSNLFKPLRLIV
jgi:hypothetical protein